VYPNQCKTFVSTKKKKRARS